MRSLLWFRKCLRLHDNPALIYAADGADEVFPVFVLDPWFVKSGRVGPVRLKFLHEALVDLDRQLHQKFQSRLIVLHGNPVDLIPKLVRDLGICKLCFERDTEPYAMDRDEAILQSVYQHSKSVKMYVPTSHTLFDPDDIIHANDGSPPKTYQTFLNAMSKFAPRGPLLPLNQPQRVPSYDMSYFSSLHKGTDLLEAEFKKNGNCSSFPFSGGESKGLEIMTKWVDERVRDIWTFEKPRTAPTDFGPASTTQLSPYLKFGCLSSRLLYHQIQKAIEKAPKHVKTSRPPVSLDGQLLWREFFYMVSWGCSPGFDSMQHNQLCLQIPWKRYSGAQGSHLQPSASDAETELVRKWENAETGYPWIDAAMTQLREEGWMHHLTRHAVACFLTRGQLFCSWEAGRDVFDKYLVDADWALNNGNWLWLSASAFFHQYFRVYSPIAFPKKTDPDGRYVKHFLPCLAGFPPQYIYEPWKAPLDVQIKAKCIIGQDYPSPCVDHDVVSKANLSCMKDAYAAAKSGVCWPESKSFSNRWAKMLETVVMSVGEDFLKLPQPMSTVLLARNSAIPPMVSRPSKRRKIVSEPDNADSVLNAGIDP
eukprot:ANDGO_02732.mRNA.1 (6-4)DNA photolyase